MSKSEKTGMGPLKDHFFYALSSTRPSVGTPMVPHSYSQMFQNIEEIRYSYKHSWLGFLFTLKADKNQACMIPCLCFTTCEMESSGQYWRPGGASSFLCLSSQSLRVRHSLLASRVPVGLSALESISKCYDENFSSLHSSPATPWDQSRTPSNKPLDALYFTMAILLRVSLRHSTVELVS